MKLFKYSFIIIFILFSFQSFSQVLPPANVSIKLKSDTTSGTISMSSLFQNNAQSVAPSQNVILTTIVELQTITDVSKIHIKVGSTAGGHDIAQQVFVFDSDDALPSGYSYYRDGLKVKLGLGTHNNLSSIYIEAKVEDINGNVSTEVSYSNL